mgnify:FL=1
MGAPSTHRRRQPDGQLADLYATGQIPEFGDVLLGVVGRRLAGGTGHHLSFGGLINGSRDGEPFVGEVLKYRGDSRLIPSARRGDV